MVISKSKLKAHFLEVCRAVEESGEEVIVTHHGVPVLRLQPYSARRPVDAVFGGLREQSPRYTVDLDTPTTSEWLEA